MATTTIHSLLGDNGKPLRPVGDHTEVADCSSALTFTPTSGAKRLLLQPSAQAIRVTFDGTVPTTDKGFIVAAGDMLLVYVCDGMTVKLIEDAASATLEYQWFE
jgi:hypothetical protein